ncbi:MAG: ABC transporter substrate-binding protein [Guyparkeria sp.]
MRSLSQILTRIMAMALLASAVSLSMTPARAQDDAQVRIGFVMFLSGGAAGPFGVPARNAAELVVQTLNAGGLPAPYDSPGIAGATIVPVYVDEASKESVVDYRNLVQKQDVDLVIGYISSGNCKAIAPVAEELERLTVFFDCGTPQIFEDIVTDPQYLFRTGAHATMDSVAAARYLLEQDPDVSTVGSRTEASRHEEAVRDLLVGLGFEDLLNFNLTSPSELFDRMTLETKDGAYGAGEPPELIESYSEDFTVLRTWVLPSLMQVLENNTHRSYPQHLSEIGFVAEIDDSTVTNVAEGRAVAGVLAGPEASYEAAKGRLQVLADNFGVELDTPPTTHPSFIEGRVADVVLDGAPVGVIGELQPAVLVEHDLEVPVAGFEFDLEQLR